MTHVRHRANRNDLAVCQCGNAVADGAQAFQIMRYHEHGEPKRLLQRAESYLLRVPIFRTIYAPVKQLVVAFSPDNEYGFKRVVMVEDAARGFQLGFLTKEFTVDRGQGPEAMVAVYVPTNLLYLGDVIIYPRDKASYPDITVEQGISLFLTGGMSLSSRVRARRGDDRVGDFRV